MGFFSSIFNELLSQPNSDALRAYDSKKGTFQFNELEALSKDYTLYTSINNEKRMRFAGIYSNLTKKEERNISEKFRALNEGLKNDPKPSATILDKESIQIKYTLLALAVCAYIIVNRSQKRREVAIVSQSFTGIEPLIFIQNNYSSMDYHKDFTSTGETFWKWYQRAASIQGITARQFFEKNYAAAVKNASPIYFNNLNSFMEHVISNVKWY